MLLVLGIVSCALQGHRNSFRSKLLVTISYVMWQHQHWKLLRWEPLCRHQLGRRKHTCKMHCGIEDMKRNQHNLSLFCRPWKVSRQENNLHVASLNLTKFLSLSLSFPATHLEKKYIHCNRTDGGQAGISHNLVPRCFMSYISSHLDHLAINLAMKRTA